MSEEKSKGFWTLKVPKDRNKKEFFKIQLRDIDEATYLAAMTMLNAKKEFESVRFIIKTLYVGGDSAEELCNNFISILSANQQLIELMEPMEGELKKN
jgi:hypothetical protein